MKTQVRTKKCTLPNGSNLTKMEQIANSRLKIMHQEPQTHITNPFKHFFSSFFCLKLFARGKRYIFGLSTSLLARTGAGFFSSSAWGSAKWLGDAVNEDGHDGSTDESRDGHSHKPRHEDVSEKTPIYSLPRAQPSYCNHRAHLQTQQFVRNPTILCNISCLNI